MPTRLLIATASPMSRGQENRPGDVTRLLQLVAKGDSNAFDRLMPLVYDELREIARRQLREERPGHTLDTSALTHEAYLKLVDEEVDWENRAHFFVLAARAMRQILIDYARKRNAQKRGGDWTRTTLSPRHLRMDVQMGELLDLDEGLERFQDVDERASKVVELRFFGGMTEDEVAEVLDVSTRTVQRDWRKARAWLYKELYSEEE